MALKGLTKIREFYPKSAFFGKKHSQESKNKIGIKNKKSVGIKNSQYDTMWITNGSENRKIKKIETIPEDWYRGRCVVKKL
jgi:hypothetical protein